MCVCVSISPCTHLNIVSINPRVDTLDYSGLVSMATSTSTNTLQLGYIEGRRQGVREGGKEGGREGGREGIHNLRDAQRSKHEWCQHSGEGST